MTLFLCEGEAVSNLSVLAYERTDRKQQRERVFSAIREAGADGLTVDELAANWGVQRHTLSPRFTELKSKGSIRVIGQRPTPTGAMAGVHFAD
jgi:DNA-binding transcriptional regulator YhcF (GntR family)